MTKLAKHVSTALAVAVIATGTFAAAPASAAMMRMAPVESTAGTATNVAYYGGYYGGYHCYWKKRKIWSYYGWHWKRFKVCY